MEMETKKSFDYKQDIHDTRVGCLGGSDAKMLAMVALNGQVPKSAYKRLAVVRGLVENKEFAPSKAMAFGDFIEQSIYENLRVNDERYQSNPLWVSDRYSKKNVKLIAHPDIVLVDDAKKTLFVYEVKTTKFSVEETRETYRAQLYVEYLLGKEVVESLGKGWRIKLSLVHYDTNGVDVENGAFEYDDSRISIIPIVFRKQRYFDIDFAMSVVDEFLETFDAYFEGDEVDANYLPTDVKREFDLVTDALREIKERERLVDEFKVKLYEFMVAKDIKSVKNEVFSITRVDPTESRSFDYKTFLEDYRLAHPTKARRLRVKYEKVTKKKGYALIKLKGK